MAKPPTPLSIDWQVNFAELQQALKRREGIVLIDTAVERPVASWKLDKLGGTTNAKTDGLRSTTIKPKIGRTVTAIILRSGRYHWKELSVPHFNLPYRHNLRKNPSYGFQVKPNTITYFGTLFVGKDRGSDSVDVRLLNRSAELALWMRKHKIAVPHDIPWVFGGPWQDPFLDRFLPLTKPE